MPLCGSIAFLLSIDSHDEIIFFTDNIQILLVVNIEIQQFTIKLSTKQVEKNDFLSQRTVFVM